MSSAIRRIIAVTISMLVTLPLLAFGAEQAPPLVAAKKANSAAKPVSKERVIFQMSDADPKKWNLALNNIKNVQTDLGADKTELELVAYGPGIGMLKADAESAGRIEEAIAAGVRVVACENTMRNQNITRNDMHKNIDFVASGVVELMRRQQQGYAYIRP